MVFINLSKYVMDKALTGELSYIQRSPVAFPMALF